MRVLILLLFSLPNALSAQLLSRTLISSAGDYSRSSDFHLSYSIGEPISFTSAPSSTYWRIGFQQGVDDLFSNIPDSKVLFTSLSLYPNPVATGHTIFYKSSLQLQKDDLIYIIGGDGRIVSMQPVFFGNEQVSEYLLGVNWRGNGLFWLVIARNGQPIGKTSFIKL